jgi:pimeloyl-ACP methyl ester carboxylesterase
MRAFFNFSPTSLMDKYLANRFRSAGLVSKFVEIDSDGTTVLHCWVPKERSAGRVEKPALVMLHGFGSTAVWQWYKQIPALQPFFDVYVPDLLFFGQSFTRKKERTEIFQVSDENDSFQNRFPNIQL